MQACENRHAASLGIARLLGDIHHQLIDRVGQRLYLARLAANGQGVGLIVDRDANRFALSSGIHADGPPFGGVASTPPLLEIVYDPASRSIWPRSFSMRTRACLRCARKSSSSWRSFPASATAASRSLRSVATRSTARWMRSSSVARAS